MIKCEECETDLAVEDKDNYKCWKCGFKKGKGDINFELDIPKKEIFGGKFP